MKSFAIHTALLAGFGALLFMGTAATTVPAAAKCMIDEGNGRRTPCEAMYKSAKCFVDEGNGRRTPCDAMLKHQKMPKHQKKAVNPAVRSTATQAVPSAPVGQSAPVGNSGRSDRSGGRAASF